MSQPYVFISYASADRERVLEIVAALREVGMTCWLDQHDIAGGSNWGGSIAEAIKGCAALVLLSSAASLASRNVRQEIALAWQQDTPCLPLRLDATPVPTDLAYWLATAQWIEVLDHSEATWLPKVTHAISRLTSQRDSRASTPAPDVASQTMASTFLPSPASSFIGREREVAEIAALLRTERIVTLTGPGGIGKTRVAIAVGHRLCDEYADGVVFVDLAPLSDPALVLSTVAARLNVREAAGQPIREQLALALHNQHLLLILDNLEQVIDVAVDLGWLVAQCPSLALLSTSREALRISGEVEYPIAPLPVPDERGTLQVETLRQNPTIALFIQRARAAKPGFDLSAENAATVAAICARLDGLPLAIELASARIRALSPQALLERLSDPLRFLTGGARDLPDRQRTIRDTIQWSFDLLTPHEQRLLCRLSVFVGGWTLDAAEAVVNIDERLELDVLDGLMSLADKSLITQQEQADGDIRFDMLTTIREFARKSLSQQGDLTALHRAHAVWFVQRLEAIDPFVHEVSLFPAVLFADQEYLNLSAAIRWGLCHATDLSARLVVPLHEFWMLRGQVREGFDLATAALAGYSQPDVRRARLMTTASMMAISLGDRLAAIRLAEDALTIARSLGHEWLLAQTLMQAGLAHLTHGDLDHASQRLEEGVPLYRRHGDGFSGGNPFNPLVGLGQVAAYRGDFERAEALMDEAVAFERRRPEPIVRGVILTGLAHVLVARGEHQRALALYREVLTQPVAYADIRFVAVSIEGVAAILAATDPEHATMLLAAARAVRDRIAFRMKPRVLNTEQRIADLRRTLDTDLFAAVWQRGQHMSLDEAKAFALGQIDG